MIEPEIFHILVVLSGSSFLIHFLIIYVLKTELDELRGRIEDIEEQVDFFLL